MPLGRVVFTNFKTAESRATWRWFTGWSPIGQLRCFNHTVLLCFVMFCSSIAKHVVLDIFPFTFSDILQLIMFEVLTQFVLEIAVPWCKNSQLRRTETSMIFQDWFMSRNSECKHLPSAYVSLSSLRELMSGFHLYSCFSFLKISDTPAVHWFHARWLGMQSASRSSS